MKLKEQKRLGMLYFVLGAVLAIAGYFIKSSWLASFGGGVCVLGLVRLLRAARLSRDPDQAADYDASLQDERTAYVANKARSLTFFYLHLRAAACRPRSDSGFPSAAHWQSSLRADLYSIAHLYRVLLVLQS